MVYLLRSGQCLADVLLLTFCLHFFQRYLADVVQQFLHGNVCQLYACRPLDDVVVGRARYEPVRRFADDAQLAIFQFLQGFVDA